MNETDKLYRTIFFAKPTTAVVSAVAADRLHRWNVVVRPIAGITADGMVGAFALKTDHGRFAGCVYAVVFLLLSAGLLTGAAVFGRYIRLWRADGVFDTDLLGNRYWL